MQAGREGIDGIHHRKLITYIFICICKILNTWERELKKFSKEIANYYYSENIIHVLSYHNLPFPIAPHLSCFDIFVEGINVFPFYLLL